MLFDRGPLHELVTQLAKLPGVGRKTAERLAMHMLRAPGEEVHALAAAMLEVKDRIQLCEICFNLTDIQPCSLCADENRSGATICVVEQPQDVIAIEKSGAFTGKYHVLHGALSPLDNVGPEEIRIAELLARIDAGGVEEVILATNPNREGEATASYLVELLESRPVEVSRIAHGVPVGSDLEYADSVTLKLSLEGRKKISRTS
ncbi:MAG: recombination mediator RecR [Candidatus Lernaella stagnicola]|nr:recombination mediator RecR [Candidatus Lernaella stagnicola]